MAALVFAPAYNTIGKSDATGAFHPEAKAFVRLHSLDGSLTLFDNHAKLAVRRKHAVERISQERLGSVSLVAYFGHGLKDGIQLGFKMAHVRALAEALARVSEPELTVALYACDTGKDDDEDKLDDLKPGPGGDGGFADALRGHLFLMGVKATVYAHAATGHTTRLPFVRVFEPGELGGGSWLIEPGSKLWRPWVYALRNTSLRLRFPLMTREEIEAELTLGVA
jgi:hypothetical protein